MNIHLTLREIWWIASIVHGVTVNAVLRQKRRSSHYWDPVSAHGLLTGTNTEVQELNCSFIQRRLVKPCRPSALSHALHTAEKGEEGRTSNKEMWENETIKRGRERQILDLMCINLLLDRHTVWDSSFSLNGSERVVSEEVRLATIPFLYDED